MEPDEQHRGRGARARVQERAARGRRDRPARRAGRDLRLPRAERRRQVDHGPDADDAAAAHGRHGPRRRLRRRQGGPEGALRDRRGAPGSGARSDADGSRPSAPAVDAAGDLPRRAQAALAGAARPRRPERGGRSQGRRLLRRDEAPARSRARARAPAADHLPRRADDGPRRPEPHRPLGRGRAASPTRTA